MRHYFAPSHFIAGFLVVLIGFTSSAPVVLQAVQAVGASSVEGGSWIFALCVGVALSCLSLSFYYRMPILTAWSTPGAALLVSSLPGITLSQAIGAFIITGLLTLITAATGWFGKIMEFIPRPLASAMLAGILLHFCLNIFTAMQSQLFLVLGMLIVYLGSKRFWPRFSLLIALLVGVVLAGAEGLIHVQNIHFAITKPIFTRPEFTWSALISISLPLFIVTMTSQNIPGFSVLYAEGYRPPISPILAGMGLTNILMAPFGGYAFNMAAITAAICANDEADKNPALRYRASVVAALLYLMLGLMGATVVSLFAALPAALVAAIAGLALMGVLSSSLKDAMDSEVYREPALLTFLVSASGVNLFGISAAFWGLLIGIVVTRFFTKPIAIIRIANATDEPIN